MKEKNKKYKPTTSCYQKAQENNDERVNFAIDTIQKNHREKIALILLCGLLVFYSFILKKEPTLVPYYVVMNNEEKVINVIPATDVRWEPKESTIKKELKEWIKNSKRVSIDAFVNNERTEAAFSQALSGAQQKLNSYYVGGVDKDGDGQNEDGMAPNKLKEKMTIDVKDLVVTQRPNSKRTYTVRWKEFSYSRATGKLIGGKSTSWVADITIAIKAPENIEQLNRFPLGIYIADFSWSME